MSHYYTPHAKRAARSRLYESGSHAAGENMQYALPRASRLPLASAPVAIATAQPAHPARDDAERVAFDVEEFEAIHVTVSEEDLPNFYKLFRASVTLMSSDIYSCLRCQRPCNTGTFAIETVLHRRQVFQFPRVVCGKCIPLQRGYNPHGVSCYLMQAWVRYRLLSKHAAKSYVPEPSLDDVLVPLSPVSSQHSLGQRYPMELGHGYHAAAPSQHVPFIRPPTAPQPAFTVPPAAWPLAPRWNGPTSPAMSPIESTTPPSDRAFSPTVFSDSPLGLGLGQLIPSPPRASDSTSSEDESRIKQLLEPLGLLPESAMPLAAQKWADVVASEPGTEPSDSRPATPNENVEPTTNHPSAMEPAGGEVGRDEPGLDEPCDSMPEEGELSDDQVLEAEEEETTVMATSTSTSTSTYTRKPKRGKRDKQVKHGSASQHQVENMANILRWSIRSLRGTGKELIEQFPRLGQGIIFVQQVVRGSAAFDVGLRPGDIITRLDEFGQDTWEPHMLGLLPAYMTERPDQDIEVTWLRLIRKRGFSGDDECIREHTGTARLGTWRRGGIFGAVLNMWPLPEAAEIDLEDYMEEEEEEEEDDDEEDEE